MVKKLSLDIGTITSKVAKYKQILKNTIQYRQEWHVHLKSTIVETLEFISEESSLGAKVHVRDSIENMEAVVFDLGRVHSGMKEKIDQSDIKKTIVKTQGALVYQQLFNGKIMVMIILPYIEGYGEPRPPKNVEILRPEELKQGFILRHVEEFLKDVTDWEDYDDDQPAKPVIGFNSTIGFNNSTEDGLEEMTG
jgi:DUF438 domain-containing protein